jgi:hypothetical protein
MVSNGERITNMGLIQTVGDQSTREWSALISEFIEKMDTTFADRYAVQDDGSLVLVNTSLMLSVDCAETVD